MFVNGVSWISFESGAQLAGGFHTTSLRPTDRGTLEISVNSIESQSSDRLGGGKVDFETTGISIDYSWPFRDDLYLGVGFGYSRDRLNLVVQDAFPATSQSSESEIFDGAFGVYHNVDETWSLGFATNLAFGRSKSRITINPPGITLLVKDEPYALDFRGGVGYNPADQPWGVYADIIYFHAANTEGKLDAYRLDLGTQYQSQTVEGLQLIAGTSIDSDLNISLGAGASMPIFDNILIDASYLYDGFPEMQAELGDSHTLLITLLFVF